MTQQMEVSRNISVVLVTGNLYNINNNLTAANYFIAVTNKLRQMGVKTVLRVNGQNGLPSADGYIFHGDGSRFYKHLSPDVRNFALLFSCVHGYNNEKTQQWLDDISSGLLQTETPEDVYFLSLDQELALQQLCNKIKAIKDKMYLMGRTQRRFK